MDNHNWYGIMKVLEIQHLDKNGHLLWEQTNINNLLHLQGEQFILAAVFTGGVANSIIPNNYYLGMDNRYTIAADDTMSDLDSEPSYGGYTRALIPSSGDFTVTYQDGHYRAVSLIKEFHASGSSWGPVKNLFLSNTSGTGGLLISSAELSTSLTVVDGELVTVRIGMALRDCPTS